MGSKIFSYSNYLVHSRLHVIKPLELYGEISIPNTVPGLPTCTITAWHNGDSEKNFNLRFCGTIQKTASIYIVKISQLRQGLICVSVYPCNDQIICRAELCGLIFLDFLPKEIAERHFLLL